MFGFLKNLFGSNTEPTRPNSQLADTQPVDVQPAEAPGAPAAFEILQAAMQEGPVAIVRDLIEDPENDVISGTLRFDEKMRIKKMESLQRNGIPAMPNMETIEKANAAFAPIAQLDKKMHFTGLDFRFEKGAMESNLSYDDQN